nr:hypothetical protein Iba_contig2927CG0010 [Ipomoea batatas]
MTPKLLRQKSPRARDMARPGKLVFGSHTLATSGSSRRANTRPLHLRILSASTGRLGLRSTVNCTAVRELSSLSLVPSIALESPTFAITRFWPCFKRVTAVVPL